MPALNLTGRLTSHIRIHFYYSITTEKSKWREKFKHSSVSYESDAVSANLFLEIHREGIQIP